MKKRVLLLGLLALSSTVSSHVGEVDCEQKFAGIVRSISLNMGGIHLAEIRQQALQHYKNMSLELQLKNFHHVAQWPQTESKKLIEHIATQLDSANYLQQFYEILSMLISEKLSDDEIDFDGDILEQLEKLQQATKNEHFEKKIVIKDIYEIATLLFYGLTIVDDATTH